VKKVEWDQGMCLLFHQVGREPWLHLDQLWDPQSNKDRFTVVTTKNDLEGKKVVFSKEDWFSSSVPTNDLSKQFLFNKMTNDIILFFELL